MKAYGGVKHSSNHLNLGPAERQVVNITPRPLCPQERTPIPTELEAGWAPELVWTFGRREKSVVPKGFRTPDRPVRNLVTVLTELSRLVLPSVYIKYVVREPQKLRTTAMFVHAKYPNSISHTVYRYVYCLSAWQQTSHALLRCFITYRKAKENGSYRKYSHGRHVIILRLRYIVSGP
jgi:hypothetical protein